MDFQAEFSQQHDLSVGLHAPAGIVELKEVRNKKNGGKGIKEKNKLSFLKLQA